MQKIKSFVVKDENGQRHLFRRNSAKIPAAPSAPAPLTATIPHDELITPINDQVLLDQRDQLVHIDEPTLMREREADLFVQGTAMEPIMSIPVQEPQTTLLMKEPTVYEQIEKPIVVQWVHFTFYELVRDTHFFRERIHPVVKEEIMPVIYREREQMDVKQITQLLHETEIKPTIIEQVRRLKCHVLLSKCRTERTPRRGQRGRRRESRHRGKHHPSLYLHRWGSEIWGRPWAHHQPDDQAHHHRRGEFPAKISFLELTRCRSSPYWRETSSPPYSYNKFSPSTRRYRIFSNFSTTFPRIFWRETDHMYRL